MTIVKVKQGYLSPSKSWDGFNILRFLLGQRKTIQAIILMILVKYIHDEQLAQSIGAVAVSFLIELSRFYFNKID